MKLNKLIVTLLLAFSAQANATIVNIDATKYGYNSPAGATVGDAYMLTNYDPFASAYTKLVITLTAGDYTWANAAGLVGATYTDYALAYGGGRWAWDFAAFDDSNGQLLFTGGINQQSSTSAAQTLSTGLTGSFSLTQTTTLTFAVRDYLLSDNSGGVSLSISAVPEADSYAMMLAGLGLVGFAARRKQV